MPRMIADLAQEENVAPHPAADAPGKRALDIGLAALLILLTLPLLLAATMMLACEGPGPILVGRPRVGRNGTTFDLLRFRTAPAHGPAEALSPVGRLLRMTRIVTLPQLFNVLRGDMSMVGPHPLTPEVAARRALMITGYDRRAAARPGLTGHAQLRRPRVADLSEARAELRDDLDYVANPSTGRDLRIIAAALHHALVRGEQR